MDILELQIECAKIAKDIIIGLGDNLHFGSRDEEKPEAVKKLFKEMYHTVLETVSESEKIDLGKLEKYAK